MFAGKTKYEKKEADGVLEIVLKGDIDHHSAVGIRVDIDNEIAESKPKKLVIDLSGIEFMDSSGLGLVMGRYAKMQKIGGELTLCGLSDRTRKIFELAGLDKMIRMEQKAGRNKND